MEGKLYLNGVKVKRSNSFNIPDSRIKTDFPLSNKGELSFSFDLRPNWLWQHKQKTGIPKNIEVMPWQ